MSNSDTNEELGMKRLTLSCLMAATLALGLAACGTGTGERALSGAGVGAAVGAGAAAITGGDVGKGAVIGGGRWRCHRSGDRLE